MARKKIDYASLYTLRSDGRYMGYWRDAQGKRHAVYDRDPESLHKKIEAAEARGTALLTFKDIAEDWERTHYEEIGRGTENNYRPIVRRLIAELGNRAMEDIEASDINQILLDEKVKQYSSKHASAVKSVLCQIYDHAIYKKAVKYNIARTVSIPRGMPKSHIEAPDEATAKLISENFDKPFGDFVAMLYYTGMRTEEAVALKWGDVGKKSIHIHAAAELHGTPIYKDTKTEAGERSVPILEKHRPYLIRPENAKNDDFVFSDDGSTMLSRGQVRARWKNWCRIVGLTEKKEYQKKKSDGSVRRDIDWKPTVTPHQLRHHYATILYEQKVDLLTTKDLMGHKEISTTQKIYTSLRKKHREEEIAKINNGF